MASPPIGDGHAARRVPGWDLLRAACAYGVASYHLMGWQRVADVYVLGLQGVYIFFVLSGASLTLNHYHPLTTGSVLRQLPSFWWQRYWRLFPLFALVLALSMPWMIGAAVWSTSLWLRMLANLTFTFGLNLPAASSMVVGGWSLGIEFTLYLIFPMLVAWLGPRAANPRMWLALLALLAMQAFWISSTLARGPDVPTQWTQYHQVPAFAGYFFGGCVIGWLEMQRCAALRVGPMAWCLVLLMCFALMLALSPASAALALLGWRGTVLGALCFGLVWWAGRLDLPCATEVWALRAGELTYGVYLLHPVLYFGAQQVGLDQALGLDLHSADWTQAVPIGIGVLLLSSALAWLSNRFYEKPLRRWAGNLAWGVARGN